MQRPLLLGCLLTLYAGAAAASPLHLDRNHHTLELPEGYSRVIVDVQPGTLVSLILMGSPRSLAHFTVDEATIHDPLDEDGLLPKVASFLPREGTSRVTLSLEVHDPARLIRVEAPLSLDLPSQAQPLIGLPAPGDRSDGYLLERPGRYQFARPDVITALLGAFRDTRARFRRDPIGVVDLSQWDALRPAMDQNLPRHVSHEGGRDVDIALPSTEEPSTRRDHCDKLISKDYTTGLCRRGTARSVDYLRLAFLLGRLVKTNHIDKIFLDAEFIPPTAAAARRLVHPPSFPAWVAARLQPDAGIVRHVAWHTDHVHIRFLGPQGISSVHN
ncbi:MAG: hypothetical protein RMJ98_03935 [Myxococcales bacterium]|nr:hypothetical protein [Polyangiaceae bacterium]MDW8248439.1 hypothetical protein [Myxococcales bacterium]